MKVSARGAVAGITIMLAIPALGQERKATDPNRKVCRRYDTTGSLLGFSSVCHTVADWQRIDQGNTAIAKEATDPRGRFGGFSVSKDDKAPGGT